MLVQSIPDGATVCSGHKTYRMSGWILAPEYISKNTSNPMAHHKKLQTYKVTWKSTSFIDNNFLCGFLIYKRFGKQWKSGFSITMKTFGWNGSASEKCFKFYSLIKTPFRIYGTFLFYMLWKVPFYMGSFYFQIVLRGKFYEMPPLYGNATCGSEFRMAASLSLVWRRLFRSNASATSAKWRQLVDGVTENTLEHVRYTLRTR